MIVWASDPDAADAYPIVTYTWLICYKKYPDKSKLQAMQDLVKYGLTDGQKDAESLGYIPLPAERRGESHRAPCRTSARSSADGLTPCRMATPSAPSRFLLPSGALFEARAGRDHPGADAASGADRPRVPRDVPGVCRVSPSCSSRSSCCGSRCRRCPPCASTGSGSLTGRVWDPNTERYGILAEIWGTLYTSVLALSSAAPSASRRRSS